MQLKINEKSRLAYLFSAGLIADTAAMPLITSNPINILSADFFHYTFIEHLIFMAPIAAATIASSMLLVYVFFRKKIPQTYDVHAADVLTSGQPPISRGFLKVCLGTLVAIDYLGYVLTSLVRVPVSLVICLGALFLMLVYGLSFRAAASGGEKKSLLGLVRDINWDIILFMLSIFLVVQGLENAGVSELLANVFVQTSALPSMLGVFVPSLIVTVGASFMNNWPMTILGMLSIKQAVAVAGITGPALTGLIFSNVIGNNLGPHFFPLGSLAILMWLECMRKRGVKISLKEYLKVGAAVSVVEVAVASIVLWLELNAGFVLQL